MGVGEEIASLLFPVDDSEAQVSGRCNDDDPRFTEQATVSKNNLWFPMQSRASNCSTEEFGQWPGERYSGSCRLAL